MCIRDRKYNCALKRLDWQQEQAFVSSLALGYNEVEIQRGMTTSSTAIFIPFMTRELRMAGPSLYYGMNALSHNVIMADRKKLKSANGLYLGSTGSGKSFAAKREIINVFLTIPKDRIIIVDPMGEYAPVSYTHLDVYKRQTVMCWGSTTISQNMKTWTSSIIWPACSPSWIKVS